MAVQARNMDDREGGKRRKRTTSQATNLKAPAGSAERLALMAAAEAYARKRPNESLTIASITLNPWNAVYQGALDLDVARAALAVTTRLAKECSDAFAAGGFNGDGFAGAAANDAAKGWQEFVK